MSVIAAKFGGSSVCDAQMFRAVHDILNQDAARKYIILSAPGKRSPADEKITDLFLRAYAAKPPEDQFIFAQIFQRYTSIRDQLCPTFDLEGETERIFANIRISRDYAASRGEYLCAKLFAAAFGLSFVDAQDLLFFDKSGAIDRARSFSAIRSALLPLERAVIPGFYASSPSGIRTFSRGGSDVSGAWIAAAVNADLYENWTDVDGVYSADPALIPDAMLHPRISLDQMRQMALAGAKILHPDALLPLQDSGIPTLIRNTLRPKLHGTLVCSEKLPCVPAVTGCSPLLFAEQNPFCPLSLNPRPKEAANVALISVFGANENSFREIAARYKCIHIIHMPEHIQIITEMQHYQTTLTDIHRILAENCSA